MENESFTLLINFLEKIPSVKQGISSGWHSDSLWWVKFRIDIHHELAWQTVQEIGHVMNYISLNERLPTQFYPVSPPPYLNGGPDDFLSWIIENTDRSFTPDKCAEWLKGRLPNPVDDLKEWADEE